MAFRGDEHPMQRIYSATAVSGHGPDFHDENEYTQDEVEIARFGKKQQLRVRLLASMPFPSSLLELLMDWFTAKFGLVFIVGLTSTLMITWEGSLMSDPQLVCIEFVYENRLSRFSSVIQSSQTMGDLQDLSMDSFSHG